VKREKEIAAPERGIKFRRRRRRRDQDGDAAPENNGVTWLREPRSSLMSAVTAASISIQSHPINHQR
jgi:hypothetical protein